MRVVLDTNVLLAGLATHGLCAALVLLCFRDHEVVISQHLLDEVARHYRTKFKAGPPQVKLVLATLQAHGHMVVPSPVPSKTFDDPDDLPILGTAVAGEAKYLVTGDKKLAELGRYQKVKIVAPREFYERLRGE